MRGGSGNGAGGRAAGALPRGHLLYPGRGGGVAGLRSEAGQQQQPHRGLSCPPARPAATAMRGSAEAAAAASSFTRCWPGRGPAGSRIQRGGADVPPAAAPARPAAPRGLRPTRGSGRTRLARGRSCSCQVALVRGRSGESQAPALAPGRLGLCPPPLDSALYFH